MHVGMRKTVLLLAMLAAALIMAGCGGPTMQQDKAKRQSASKEQQAAPEKEKTVVVNEGMSEKEEKELNERLAELEEKVNDQPQQESANQEVSEEPEQDAESAEQEALEAAQDYYAAAAGGNYSYTYSNLSAVSQSQFTEDEWVSDNTALGSDAGTYSVNSVEMVDDSTAEVQLTITSADGSSSERTTWFVLENGSWKHELTPAEYELFAGATSTTSASATSASAPASANGNTKHVEIVITSNKPADVSISDDSFNWFINEEIVGTETYERDIATNSGLSVGATTEAYQAQTTIEVYENGELVAQDTDPNGFALVNY
ncbi:MAG: hypothetical protein M3151_14590 [Actinomycetota bacterium]|nr:hypothetical protein [Actinomycetota bacterium]